jgi:GNAT superfamily N-acetyltransferase
VSIEVRPASADEVRRLRRDVLRPNGTLDPPPYDLEPATMHVAALDGGAVVGCATVFPQPYADEPRAWQMRGMAVDPAYQGRGIGRLVLEAATDVVRATQAPLIWANGRISAMSFYQGLGWESVGEIFEYGPASLPHLVVIRALDG